MNYIMIRTDDMLNGDGLRVVLFCTSCNHHCTNCHNPETWDTSSGYLFNDEAKESIFKELENDYISGLTLSGGDPLHENNLNDILHLCEEVKEKYPDTTIWLYTGYTWNQIMYPIVTDDLNSKRDSIINNRKRIVELCDVLVDGEFKENLSDVNYRWAGSTNQKVIDIQESLKQNKIVLYCD